MKVDRMTEALWPFSLRFYDDEDVQSACLALQDRFGGDVNVALCLLWHAGMGRVLSDEDVAKIDAEVSLWRVEVVQPLRALRRQLKADVMIGDAETQNLFRTKVKSVELSAEKVEQTVLSAVEVSPIRSEPIETAAKMNLTAYGRLLQQDIAPDVVGALAARAAVIH